MADEYRTSFALDGQKSDTVDLDAAHSPVAIYVGVTGDVKAELYKDTPGTPSLFKAVPAGTTLRLKIRRLWSTGTTATNIIGLR